MEWNFRKQFKFTTVKLVLPMSSQFILHDASWYVNNVFKASKLYIHKLFIFQAVNQWKWNTEVYWIFEKYYCTSRLFRIKVNTLTWAKSGQTSLTLSAALPTAKSPSSILNGNAKPIKSRIIIDHSPHIERCVISKTHPRRTEFKLKL